MSGDATPQRIHSAAALRIGILGTRGIPNRYGGFEECAEHLAQGLVAKGHQVTVYNSSRHEYRADSWHGVRIVHCPDPEHRLGTAGQFLYDLACIRDARRRGFDIVLQLGYTSSSVWWPLWPRRAVNIVNMDGLEWKRSKFSPRVQAFLKKAERWAARHADVLVSDSPGIQAHISATYGRASVYIPYGAFLYDQPDAGPLRSYNLKAGSYDLLIARMEPENSIEPIIRGHLSARPERPLVVVGGTGNAFGSRMRAQYGGEPGIQFTGGIYDAGVINALRHYSCLYFHGHSVGGTNPSLLEAMACSALIAAHDNVFNRAVLDDDAFYFKSADDVSGIILKAAPRAEYTPWLAANRAKIISRYSWPVIVDAYERVMLDAMAKRPGADARATR